MQTIRGGLSVRRACCSRSLVTVVRTPRRARARRFTPQLLFSVLLVSACSMHPLSLLSALFPRVYAHEHAHATTHNVIVKAFYIDPPKKKPRSLLANSEKAPLRRDAARIIGATRTRATCIYCAVRRAIRSDGSLNVSAYNGDRKFGSRIVSRRSL